MLNKMCRKFNDLSCKQLKLVCVVSLIVLALAMYLGKTLINNYIFLTITIAISFIMFVISLLELRSKSRYNNFQSQLNAGMEKLNNEFSKETYTEVQFKPDLTVYMRNSCIASENENLKRALKLLDNLNVTHFAKLENNKIIIVSKGKDGNTIGSPYVIHDPKFFKENYEILK